MPGVMRLLIMLLMNSSIALASSVIALLLIFLVGCRLVKSDSGRTAGGNGERTVTVGDGSIPHGAAIDRSKLPTADSPYVKVYVSRSGDITLDGKAATVDEVGRAFSALARKNGVLLYTRDDPDEYEPHPNAMKVIDLAIANRLVTRLCKNKDCSDGVGPDGKLIMDK